jgi:short-subunit dehydrogenase
LKKILTTGCGSGLGKCLLEESVNYDVEFFPHFKKNNQFQSAIYGDINHKEVRNQISNFIRANNINVFINNAAIYCDENLLKMNDESIFNIINTNLTSQILLIKSIYTYFIENNQGTIININSLAGKFPSANESIYCATKFGLDGFIKSLELESMAHNVKFISLYPGAMKTNMTKHRQNFETFIDPVKISKLIFNLIEVDSNTTEIIVRKDKNL